MVFIIDPSVVQGPSVCTLKFLCPSKCGIKPLYGVPLYGVEV